MKHLIVLSILFFSFSCKTQQNVLQTIKFEDKFELSAKKQYQQGEKIIIDLKNVENTPLSIIRPMEKFFYKKKGDKWEKVAIFYCPCDASCPPPPEKIELMPGKHLKINWNQKEYSCSSDKTNGVRETIKTQVKQGIYKCKITYKTKQGKEKSFFYEFEIK